MEQVHSLLLSLLRSSLWGVEAYPFTLPEQPQLEQLQKALLQQRVQTLPADVLGSLGCRAAMQEASGRISRWYQVLQAQAYALSQLEQAGITAVVLKGAASGIYYPVPEYRTMGDIDLLVQPEDFEKATAVLAKSCQRYLEKDRHDCFLVKGVNLELHRYFTDRGAQPLDEALYRGLANRETVCLNGFSFPVLPKKETGLMLLEHIRQHLAGGMGLRQMLDWVCYSAQCLDDEYYHNVFAPEARRYGLEKLAITLTRLAQLYLGLPQSITWCADGDEALCRQLLSYMLQRGDLGENDHAGTSAMRVVNMARNPIRFFKNLQTMGCRTWKALEKYPYLKCFAWAYQLCRFIRRGFGRKDAMGSLARDVKNADAVRRMLRQLEIEN